MPLNLYLKWPGLTCPSLSGFTCPLTIKKVIAWAALDESGILDRLISIFLQGIRISGKPENWAVDSHQQCQLLAEQVNRKDNPAQVSVWLTEMIRKEDFLLSGLALRDMVAEKASGTILEALCNMTQAHRAWEDTDYSASDLIHLYISPKLLGTQWHIHLDGLIQNRSSGTPNLKYLESESVMAVLKLEAILEQLIARDGICCPYYRYKSDMSEACICFPGWKQSLSRLLQWAREGKFGAGGTWRDLPPECSCGV
jgi:hypothetical protein